MSVINKSANGQLIYCEKCELFHFEFGNLNFDFTQEEFERFRNYVTSIDGDYYHGLNSHTENRRKILLPTRLKGFHFCFYPEELREIRFLLTQKPGKYTGLLSIRNMHYEFCSN